MNDRELIKKLNNLKSVGPDNEWKKNCREILHCQISAATINDQAETAAGITRLFSSLVRPLFLVPAVSAIILALGMGGIYASKNSKPGDSLYIAKIISEKTQFAMTFDEKDKVKLSVEFAANRAREITQVLEDSERVKGANDGKVEKLARNFKNEISQVKSRLTNIKEAAGKLADAEDQTEENKEEEIKVFGAESEKNDERLEIAEPAPGKIKEAAEPNKDSATEPVIETENEAAVLNATSTAEKIDQTELMLDELDEAEKLFDEKNYDGTIDKLRQLNQVIGRTEDGRVKGANETTATATTTEKDNN